MSADYPSMTTAEIRSKFLNFFEERGLKLYPSSSLVPDDPSLLLANAGMNQFKEYYQGKKTMKEIGAISCQKCVRTNDIDCIGEDGRHLSFFEMLGDFSFGGVSKQQACAWAFELITKEFKLPLDRLCLSPQCGFASCEIGNKLTEMQQWAKLALVKEIAEEVWGK